MMKPSTCGLLDVSFIPCYVVISPFTAISTLKSMNDLIQTIKTGNYSFEGDEWHNVSFDAKDLIKKLIVIDPMKRLVPLAALKHKWFDDMPKSMRTLKPCNSVLPIQKNLKKNKRKLTKSSINISNTARISFNMDIKNALENNDAINALRYENDNDGSFTDSDPPSIAEMLED